MERVEEGASFLRFHCAKKGIHQNLHFRQAIAHMIDPHHLCQEISGGNLFPASSFLYERSLQQSLPTLHPEQARYHLEQSGYDGGKIVIYGSQLRKGADYEQEVHWIQRQLQAFGVNVAVDIIAIKDLMRKEVLQEAHAVVTGIAFGENKILALIRNYQAQSSFIRNMMDSATRAWIDPEIESLYCEQDIDRVWDKLISFEQCLVSEQRILFLYHRVYRVQINMNSRIQGVRLNSCGRISYRNLWYRPHK